MDPRVLKYFNWILNEASDRAIRLLVDMYNCNFLCEPCALALEAVEALAAE